MTATVSETATSTSKSAEYFMRREKLRDIETARVRGWGYFLGAYLTGPIWPGLVANRTGQWAPFWVGLGVGVVSLPFAVFDLGILTSIPAAGVGTAMMAQKSNQKRRQLDVLTPEEADMILFSKDF